ncbi:acyl-CoA dehydrogenase family protein [Arthrobacter cavernae]|uniref:acyl-CoA dehydrogenase family protein n=1 Tax=Arthrobacter cavernae TaxID=2817681 RepID=UPI003556342B
MLRNSGAVRRPAPAVRRHLAASQIVQERLARMHSELATMQLMVMQMTRLDEEGVLTLRRPRSPSSPDPHSPVHRLQCPRPARR